MIKVLSLGAGVQSTTVLLKSIVGELPRLDCAIFADTGWEPASVYRHLDWLEQKSAKVGIPVHRVKRGDLRSDVLVSQVVGKKTEGRRFASMPLYVLQTDTTRSGMIKRQCTSEYKSEPIESFIKMQILGLSPRGRWPVEQRVQHWFGISCDEFTRARAPILRSKKGKTQPQRWKSHFYPLIGMEFFADGKTQTHADMKPTTRLGCLDWLEAHGYPRPPRSACLGCPFHSDSEWREIKSRPDEWADVVEFDRAIRNCGGLRGQAFLHRSLRPLDEIDFRSDSERGQMQLFDGVAENECTGMCGV